MLFKALQAKQLGTHRRRRLAGIGKKNFSGVRAERDQLSNKGCIQCLHQAMRSRPSAKMTRLLHRTHKAPVVTKRGAVRD